MPFDAIRTCPYCRGQVIFTNNAQLYGRPQGSWPYIYLCTNCEAAVGCRFGTDKPLGRMADRETRIARREAHRAFDWLWQSGRVSRTHAYQWLAKQMGMRTCHIGRLNVEQCQRVIELVQAFEKEY